MRYLALLAIAMMVTNCANVGIYKDESHKKPKDRIGLKFYQPTPFLLVQYNPSKDVNMKATIIYLPDLEEPHYVRARNGWGSATATLGFENGVMNSFGAVTDSKGPETVTALSSLITGTAGLLGGEGADTATEQAGDDPERSKLWEEQAKNLKEIIGEKDEGNNDKPLRGLSKLAETNIEGDGKALFSIIEELKDPILKDISLGRFQKREQISFRINELANNILDLDLPDSTRNPDNQTKKTLVKKLIAIADKINPKEINQKPNWELYKITFESDKYVFTKINVPGNISHFK